MTAFTDLATHAPELIEGVEGLVRRILETRREDRAAVIAAMHEAAGRTHGAVERAYDRLNRARIPDTGEAT